MHTVDVGVRDVVALLNHVPGVSTRASCEGAGRARGRHRHADLAYVLLRYPMPLGLQDFLIAELGSLVRVEDQGIYSRWPNRNHLFLDRLAVALRAYRRQHPLRHYHCLRWPLPRLRARLARELSGGKEVCVGLCLLCRDIVGAPHPLAHRFEPLLELAGDEQARWLAEFVSQPPNFLQSDLIAADGWARVATRTLRGDFGGAFHRRWLRYRARMIAHLATQQLRAGVERARRRGEDLDFFYDATHAIFAWGSR